MRVLVVEDERALADRVALGLRRQGLVVDVAYDGDEALEEVYTNRYDVIVLDRDLPRMHGDDVCRQVVADRDVESRILMLTASGQLDQRVEGLNLGADDYLPKPFAFKELVARVHSLARRAPAQPPVLVCGDLAVDTLRRTVVRGGLTIPVSRNEYGVLTALLRAEGAVVTADELLERVWDEHADPWTNTVRVTVGRLRRKLGEPPLIRTVLRSGYRITT